MQTNWWEEQVFKIPEESKGYVIIIMIGLDYHWLTDLPV